MSETARLLHVAALDRTARRYRDGDRFSRYYVASKLRRDPVHLAILRRAADAPFGQVLDLGCGRGQLAVALLEAGLAVAVLGFDSAPASLAAARRAGAGLPFAVEARDLSEPAPLPPADTVLLIDVLYLLDPAAGARLLTAAAAAARQRILIRTLDPGRGLRSRFAILLERLGRPIWPHSGATVAPPTVAALTARLETLGFRTAVEPCWEGTPFANVLVVADRVAPPERVNPAARVAPAAP